LVLRCENRIKKQDGLEKWVQKGIGGQHADQKDIKTASDRGKKGASTWGCVQKETSSPTLKKKTVETLWRKEVKEVTKAGADATAGGEDI